MQMTESDENSTYTYGVVSNLSTLETISEEQKSEAHFLLQNYRCGRNVRMKVHQKHSDKNGNPIPDTCQAVSSFLAGIISN